MMKKELIKKIIVWGIYILICCIITQLINAFVFSHIENENIITAANMFISLIASIPPFKCLIWDSFK